MLLEQIIIAYTHLELLSKFRVISRLLYVKGSTYITGRGLTQNFELKILWSIQLPDRFLHRNLR